jgi:hypothetical protein
LSLYTFLASGRSFTLYVFKDIGIFVLWGGLSSFLIGFFWVDQLIFNSGSLCYNCDYVCCFVLFLSFCFLIYLFISILLFLLVYGFWVFLCSLRVFYFFSCDFFIKILAYILGLSCPVGFLNGRGILTMLR